MAIQVIPDKICPHCGGNKWYLFNRILRGHPFIEYRCVAKSKELSYMQYMSGKKKEYSDKHWKKKASDGYYRTDRERNRQRLNRKQLGDSYVKSRIVAKTGRSIKSITILEIKEERQRLLKKREARNIPISAEAIINRKRDLRNNLHKHYRESLNDNYVKHVLYTALKHQGIDISLRDITDEQIEKYRQSIKIQRIVKSKEMNYKNWEAKMYREELSNLITTSQMSRNEKQAIYTKRCDLKKIARKNLSEADYNSLVAIGTEPITQKEKPQAIQESMPVKNLIEAPAESVLQEFQRIEKRRNEILSQINELNNYLETLKIKLL